MINKQERYYNEKGELGVLIGKSELFLESERETYGSFLFGYTPGHSDLNINIDKKIIEYYLSNPTVGAFMDFIINNLKYSNDDYILRTETMYGYSEVRLNEKVKTEFEDKNIKDLKIQEILDLFFITKDTLFTIESEACENEYFSQYIREFNETQIIKA